jgi:hypothetical protein
MFESQLRNELLAGLPRHRRRRQQRRIAAGACTVVAAVALGLTAAPMEDGGSSRVRTRPGAARSTETTDTGSSSTTTTITEAVPPPTTPVPGGPSLSAADVEEAEQLVRTFLDLLRAGDLTGAGLLWTGHPETMGTPPDGVQAEIAVLLERFQQETAWLLSDPEPDLIVTPGPGESDPVPVVTVVVDSPGGGRRAAAFVMTRPADDPDLRIDRLPANDPPTTPPAGADLAVGETVRIAGVPVEGTARAFVNGIEVPVRVDLVGGFTEVVVPATAAGQVTLTVALATPETLDVIAGWFPLAA